MGRQRRQAGRPGGPPRRARAEARGRGPGAQRSVAAPATFRADPAPGGARLWTETWAKTSGSLAGGAFVAYCLAIGPWSAWIRRVFLRAARERAGGSGTAPAGDAT